MSGRTRPATRIAPRGKALGVDTVQSGHAPMLLNSLASLAIRVAGAATSFGFQVLLARLLGPAHLGVYHTANSLTQIVAVGGRRGLDNVVVKRVSVACAQGRHGEAQATVDAAIGVVVRNTSAVAALMIGVSLLAGRHWLSHEDGVSSMVVFLLAALPLALIAIYGEASKAAGHPLVSAAVQGLALPLLNLLAIAVVGVYVATASLAAGVFLVSTLLTATIGARAWRATHRVMPNDHASCAARGLVAEARPFFIAAVAAMLAGSADILVLSLLGRPEEVGIYAVAARIAVLFSLVSLGVNGVVAPRFAQHAAARETAKLRALSHRACWMTAAAGAPVLLVSVLAPAWLLGIFGPEFRAGALVLQLVVAGRYVALLSSPMGHLFQMVGRAGTERNLTVGMVAALVVLAVPLTAHLGGTGTALAACIAWAGFGLARFVAARALFSNGLH